MSNSLAREMAKALADGGWRAKARPEQLPPPGDWNGWLVCAGRGFGKTRAGAEWVIESVMSGGARHVALCAPTEADARKVMIEGPSGILAVAPSYAMPIYEPSQHQLTWPNGAVATAFSSEEPKHLRGPNHDLAWADELCAWANAEQFWDMLAFGLRLGKHPRFLVTTTPKPSPVLKSLLKREDVVVTRGSTFDNQANLAPSFLISIKERYEGTRLGRQELFAELLSDVVGALWNHARIDETRVSPIMSTLFLSRIVVAIDPAVSVSKDSDETGIIVAGVDYDGHSFIIEDLSGKYQPHEWATKAISAYHRYGADRIVAEANQGGAMVEATMRAVDRNVPIRLVHASRGKRTRAEPISALYEQKRVHHCGNFPQLEDQLCSFAPGSTSSPDRLDALVWALTDLSHGRSKAELFFG